jgi:hypothetical protein
MLEDMKPIEEETYISVDGVVPPPPDDFCPPEEFTYDPLIQEEIE